MGGICKGKRWRGGVEKGRLREVGRKGEGKEKEGGGVGEGLGRVGWERGRNKEKDVLP